MRDLGNKSQKKEDAIADPYRPLFDGLKATTAALVAVGLASDQAIAASQAALVSSREAIRELQRDGVEITKMADTAMETRNEHEDLRETVARLESLVIAQGQDLRALRERLDNGGS